MIDVFVSYKREDAVRVRKLVHALRATGLNVWWDEDIPPSAPWEATIERALASAKAVIVCWSPDAVASENVRSEARVAREDRRLIQIFMKACSPPLFFGERQGVSLANWRGAADDPRIARIAQTVRDIASGKPIENEVRPKGRRFSTVHVLSVFVALLLLAAGAAGWWFMSAARAEGPMTLAVLPFRAMNPADKDLVDAIWDDTRGAIGRNPNLRVLGRQALETLAKKDLSPADYRRKVGADYLLEGSVRRIGDNVRMKISLTKTKDGSEVWSDEVGGKLDDVFAFQSRIALEVEGRIRGRVAPGGGATAGNIATTGEVYALYAQGKAAVRKRDPDSAIEAASILRRALAIDPNYAPAWADLGVATFFEQPKLPMAELRPEAIADLNRALTLAPNLGYAHAALAMVQNMPPESEPDLRRAVQLDPGNAEAWTWLGNLLLSQNRLKEALYAHDRAVSIEPLWWTAVGNKIGNLILAGDQAGLAQELGRIRQTQDEVLLAKARYRIAELTGNPGEAVQILLQLRATHPEESAAVDQRLAAPLIQLGFIEEGLRAGQMPMDVAPALRGVPPPATQIDREYRTPADFWLDNQRLVLYARLLPDRGRLPEFVGRYKAAFKSPDEFMAMFAQRLPILQGLAPTVVANLRAAGDSEDADAILRRTEPAILQQLRNGPPRPDLLALLAYYRGAEPNDDEAVRLLKRAVDGGWLPDYFWVDIATEPAFARLVGRADFQAVRQRILARIAEQRRRVDPAGLARAGLELKIAA